MAEQHANLLQLARRACDENRPLTGGHVYCLASDGESWHGKALVALAEKLPLSVSSPIYPLIHNLTLLNTMVGDQDITSDKDYKHVMKWLQHAHLHPKGVQVGLTQITPLVLQSQLESVGTSVNHLNNILNVADKQDVTTMFNQSFSNGSSIHTSMLSWAYMNNWSISVLQHMWHMYYSCMETHAHHTSLPHYTRTSKSWSKMLTFVLWKPSVIILMENSSSPSWALTVWNGYLGSFEQRTAIMWMSVLMPSLIAPLGQWNAMQYCLNTQSGTKDHIDYNSRVSVMQQALNRKSITSTQHHGRVTCMSLMCS